MNDVLELELVDLGDATTETREASGKEVEDQPFVIGKERLG